MLLDSQSPPPSVRGPPALLSVPRGLTATLPVLRTLRTQGMRDAPQDPHHPSSRFPLRPPPRTQAAKPHTALPRCPLRREVWIRGQERLSPSHQRTLMSCLSPKVLRLCLHWHHPEEGDNSKRGHWDHWDQGEPGPGPQEAPSLMAGASPPHVSTRKGVPPPSTRMFPHREEGRPGAHETSLSAVPRLRPASGQVPSPALPTPSRAVRPVTTYSPRTGLSASYSFE